MEEATIIGVDLAKNVFHLHGARADGSIAFRKKLSRPQFHKFMAGLARCLVVMEACGGAHHWAREMMRLGHDARLIAPRYVKPFVKRHKNDANDAEAIVEAATRPTMRFVEVKTEAQQERAIVFRAREQLVNRRTELVNTLRAHLYEFGYIAPYGIHHMGRIEEIVADEGTDIPIAVRDICRGLIEQIADLGARADALKKRIDAMSREAETTRRLQTMPGVGPILSLAIEAFAPPMESFRRGRDFAAWLGLVPLQKSTGGKQRLGKMSKMGQRDIRRLLIVGAMSAVVGATRKRPPEGSWLARMMARKPRMLVAVALANKMARSIWAMLKKGEDYRRHQVTPPEMA
ncbi:MAG: IS110 family transposase [Alphaproteobacteria bacterium HGW-Alphaproteobacteria-5]|nr:MAG: IS110 family transposase [Alphaproteobacteria bacterium HGW-Alphaproteobacteria-5]